MWWEGLPWSWEWEPLTELEWEHQSYATMGIITEENSPRGYKQVSLWLHYVDPLNAESVTPASNDWRGDARTSGGLERPKLSEFLCQSEVHRQLAPLSNFP